MNVYNNTFQPIIIVYMDMQGLKKMMTPKGTFSSNLHDPAGEVLKAELRLE